MKDVITKAEYIYNTLMKSNVTSTIEEVFSDSDLHSTLVDLLDSLDEINNKRCESCKHFTKLDRNGTIFKRCFFLGTVGDIGYCGRWESE